MPAKLIIIPILQKTEVFLSSFNYGWHESEFKHRSSVLKFRILHFSCQTKVLAPPPYVPKSLEADDLSSLSPTTSICSFVKWHQFNKLKKTDGEAHQVCSTQSTKVIKQLLAGTHSSLKYNNVQHYQHFSYKGLRALRKLSIIKRLAMKLHSKLLKLNPFLIHQHGFVLFIQ